MIKKLSSIIFAFALLINNFFPIEADIFVQSTVNRASQLLSENISKEEKIEKLKLIAEYTNPEIDVFNKEVLNENYTIVNSILKATSERPEVKIDWRIYTKNSEQPLIRDLIIEGLSLARTQKEEFASVLSSNNGNINALFKTLEEFSNK